MQEVIKYLSEKDSIFNLIIEKYGLPTIPKRPQGFETLVLLILEQQVSIDSAKATFLKLKAKHTLFNPESMLSFSDEEFRNSGVSRQKTSYIKALSHSIIIKHIDLVSLATKSSEQVRGELIKIKGIGHWTIDIYLMFSLQAPDIIPLGDIAVVNTIKEMLNIHDKQEMENYVSKWSPHKSLATYLLWHYYLSKRNRKVVF
ncbi:DNA-3-methyladenine glycosylase 2 family protein [Flavobacterium sp.]|uniref:DNA-3-methyladenine glycosylase family protein n=1 Tax=Flavobacterium sp. TaxID=239 RepID=UPI00286DE434|nr:DNA-3-methyladenine glycosylase 2 family protein [Flavobacterium sp.]